MTATAPRSPRSCTSSRRRPSSTSFCVNTIVDLGRAKDYAVDFGVDVITMSGGFFNTGDGAGTGTGAFADQPDGIAKAARDRGIVW